MRAFLLLIGLTSVAWASSPTPAQSAWLASLFANLFNGAPSAEVEAYMTDLVVSGTIDIDALQPPGFGGGSPQMTTETCDLLASAIAGKITECAGAKATLTACETLAGSMGQDPAVFCASQRSVSNTCSGLLTTYVSDRNLYCAD